MLRKPVLVFVESGVSIKLPIPYLDFYTQIALNESNIQAVLDLVEKGYYSLAFNKLELITCPHPDCCSEFRTLNPPDTIGVCPTCLRDIDPEDILQEGML